MRGKGVDPAAEIAKKYLEALDVGNGESYGRFRRLGQPLAHAGQGYWLPPVDFCFMVTRAGILSPRMHAMGRHYGTSPLMEKTRLLRSSTPLTEGSLSRLLLGPIF